MWHTNDDIHRGAENLLAHKRLAAQAPIVIRYVDGDEIIHTPDHPFCSDPLCDCHDDREAVRRAIIEPLDAGLITWDEGSRIFFDRQVAQERNATTLCLDGSWW